MKQTRKMMLAARTDIIAKDDERIVNENAPFELTPPSDCPKGVKKIYRRGILLTHGLKGTPYSMRALGQFFQENCFKVMAILLPGHATRPGDLLDVTWEDWIKAEAFGTDALADEVDELYLSGYSAGGTISIYQSLSDPRVKGIFLFSPAIRISSLAMAAILPKVISWAVPRAQWSEFMLDEDRYQYESFPFNAITQIHFLTKKLKTALANQAVDIPTFMAISEDDATVSTPASIAFFDSASNPANRMVFYTAKGAFPPKKRSQIEIVQSVFPDQHIIGSAHTAIIVPPDDPHFGKEANPMACSRYFNIAPEKYARCRDKKEDFLGEITDENLRKGVIRRLMYNPNFDTLKLSLKRFIDSLH
ncbi:MAG: alpha/beta hydrolase [Nitrospirae bacterium]|nr:alpha/beta hydrolase [Candidatus Troglogloeales bacterium]